MDKKSQILVTIFALIVLASIAASYYKYLVIEDIKYETDEDAFQAALLEE